MWSHPKLLSFSYTPYPAGQLIWSPPTNSGAGLSHRPPKPWVLPTEVPLLPLSLFTYGPRSSPWETQVRLQHSSVQNPPMASHFTQRKSQSFCSVPPLSPLGILFLLPPLPHPFLATCPLYCTLNTTGILMAFHGMFGTLNALSQNINMAHSLTYFMFLFTSTSQ